MTVVFARHVREKICSVEKFTGEGAKPIDPPMYSRDRRLPLARMGQRLFAPQDLSGPEWAYQVR